MNGKQIFENYRNKRGYTGSEIDNYSQLLETIHLHLLANNTENDFYIILENAEKQGKKIIISENFYKQETTNQEISINDILIK